MKIVFPGINIIGNLSSDTGLGVHARRLVTPLLARGYPAKVLDIDPTGTRRGHDTWLEDINVNNNLGGSSL